MHEQSPEEREEFNLNEFSLEQLYGLRQLVAYLAAGAGAHKMIEGRPTSRLSPDEIKALPQFEEQEIRLQERRQVGRAEAYQEIASEIELMISRRLTEE